MALPEPALVLYPGTMSADQGQNSWSKVWPPAIVPQGGHAIGSPQKDEGRTNTTATRLYLAVPIEEMRSPVGGAPHTGNSQKKNQEVVPAGPPQMGSNLIQEVIQKGGTFGGDSLVTHFKDLKDISYKFDEAGIHGVGDDALFIPLCTTVAGAVALAESRLRGIAHNINKKKRGMATWSPSDPPPPPEKLLKKIRDEEKLSMKELMKKKPSQQGDHFSDISDNEEEHAPVKAACTRTAFFVKALCITPGQFQQLVMAEKLIKCPTKYVWKDHLQFFNPLTLPMTTVQIAKDVTLDLPVEGFKAQMQLQTGPLEDIISEKGLNLMMKAASQESVIKERQVQLRQLTREAACTYQEEKDAASGSR